MKIREILIEAKNEIESLRRANEILSAKVSVMELFSIALRAHPDNGSYGGIPDVLHYIDQELEEEEEKKEHATNCNCPQCNIGNIKEDVHGDFPVEVEVGKPLDPKADHKYSPTCDCEYCINYRRNMLAAQMRA